jgi:hypothetical protein
MKRGESNEQFLLAGRGIGSGCFTPYFCHYDMVRKAQKTEQITIRRK